MADWFEQNPYPSSTGGGWPGNPNLPGYGDMTTSNPWRDSLTYQQIKDISAGVYGPGPSNSGGFPHDFPMPSYPTTNSNLPPPDPSWPQEWKDLYYMTNGTGGINPPWLQGGGGATGTISGGTSGGTLQPPNGDWQSWFMSLVGNKPWNQQTLNELMPTLQQYGIQLTPPNANGDQTKINVPGIGWVRVGFGEGHPVWIPQGTGSGGGGGAEAGGLGGSASGGGQMGLNGPFGATPFNFQYNPNDPSYQFIKNEVMGNLQNSQAARGTLLTGGALKELQDRAAALASTEYGNEFERAYRTNQLNFDQGLRANQNQFTQNYNLAGLGLDATKSDVNAAGGLGSTSANFANNMGGLYGDIGNAQAGGIAGGANARNQFYNSLINGIQSIHGSNPYQAWV